MNKFDFIKFKIKEKFADGWKSIEQKLRKLCMQSFIEWVNEEKEIDFSDLSPEELKNLVEEWYVNSRHKGEYNKKYKHELERFESCNDCVFSAPIDKDNIFCIQYVKEKQQKDSCESEPENKFSECYGELYELLEKLV